MPAIGPKIAAILILCATLPAQAPERAGLEAHDFVKALDEALFDGNGKAVVAMFDSKTAGFKQVSKDILELTKLSTAVSTIEFSANTGDDRSRELDLNWRMQIRSYNGQMSTARRARVRMHLQKDGQPGMPTPGQWRITSFAPLDFFAPPHNGAVWDVISDALTALTEGNGDPHPAAPSVPSRFLEIFDSKKPVYSQVRTNVVGLLGEGNVESSVDMLRNEGDDRQREVELDWNLRVVNRDTKIGIFHREAHVTCRLERQHGKWKIVSFDPIDFLAPQPPGDKEKAPTGGKEKTPDN